MSHYSPNTCLHVHGCFTHVPWALIQPHHKVLVVAPFVEICVDGLFSLWHREPNISFFSPKLPGTSTHLTAEHVCTDFRSLWHECAWLSPLQVAFRSGLSDSRAKQSGARTAVFCITVPQWLEGHTHSRVIYWAFVQRDLPGVPESSHKVMDCRWWKPQILYNLTLKKILFELKFVKQQ